MFHCVLIVGVMLFAPVCSGGMDAVVPVGASGHYGNAPTPPPSPGDLHVRNHTVLPDGHRLSVNGSLYLESGGVLELRNG